MTIAALLHHHGINVPRYVTVDGQIVFDNVSKSASGPIHAAFGPVTAVEKHTFHAGAEEPDDGSDGTANWWEDGEVLDRHVAAMERSFPDLAYLPPEDGRAPGWGGVINTGRGSFTVGIFTRKDESLPSVVVFGHRLGAKAGRRWITPPHTYLNGNICVAGRDDWDPTKHTVAAVTAWAAHWLAAYTEWRITRRWPVEGCQSVAA